MLFAVIFTFLTVFFTLNAFAAQTTAVYVEDGGNGDGASAEAPVGSLSAALSKLGGKGGNIILCGDTSISTVLNVPEQSGDLSFTAINGAVLKLGEKIIFEKNKNSNVTTFDLPVSVTKNGTVIIFGGFNSIVFGNGFTVTGTAASSALSFFGGFVSEGNTPNDSLITTLPYSLTVNSGTFNIFSGGNYRISANSVIGSIAAPISITVNGGTFGKVGSYNWLSNRKNYTDMSISGMSILADDATLTINGGTFNMPIFAQGKIGTVANVADAASNLTASKKEYYAIDGNIKININGGTFNGGLISAYYTQPSYTQLVRGNFDVSVTGSPVFKAGTIIDATQVKAYEGKNEKATLTYPASVTSISAKRFDVVNGTKTSYEEPLRIAFMGDSITYGYPLSTSGVTPITDSYPSVFVGLCEKDGREVIVSNYGVAGSGLTHGANRYYYNMLAYPLLMNETDATYYSIAIGTNDSCVGAANGSRDAYKNSLTELALALGSKNDTERVYITNAIFRDTSAQSSIRVSAAVHPLQEAVARELAANEPQKYIFVDLYSLTYKNAVDGTLLAADNLHPSKTGYAAMGNAMYNAIFKNALASDSFTTSNEVYVSNSGKSLATGTKTDPISNLDVAYDRLSGKEVTVYVTGTMTVGSSSAASGVFIPFGYDKVNLVGIGNGATLTVTGNTFKVGSNLKIDNLTLNSTCSAGTTFVGCYNDIEITDSVSTVGKWGFYAGFDVYTDESVSVAKGTYDTAKGVSSSNDCTVTVSGGTWAALMGGNRRCVANAPFGTYSGNMIFNVGGNATISTSKVGASGMNYLTGSITANIKGYNGSFTEIPNAGTASSPIVYNKDLNTGKVTVNMGADAVTTAAVSDTKVSADTTVSVDTAAGVKAPSDTSVATDTSNAGDTTAEGKSNIGLILGIALAIAAIAVAVVLFVIKKK